MSETPCNIQAVFVVDVSTCRQRETKWEEAISLCVFRVLCFLNSQLQTPDPKGKVKKKVLKWGYKLFDIDGQIGRVASMPSTFKDFKLKCFEEFERDLKNVTLSLMQTPPPTFSTRSRQGLAAKEGSSVSSFPAQCLSKCLTETLHDFQWEAPDIGSPVKSATKKGPSLPVPENGVNSNYVFLISRVPCDRKTLRHFSNKVVMDKDVFIESFMSQVLQKEFYVQRKIVLHWVDTGRYHPPNSSDSVPADRKSYEIVEQSLKTVGGSLASLHSLVTLCVTPDQRRHFAQVTAGGSGDDYTNGADDGAREGSGANAGTREGSVKDQVAAVLSSFSCMSACVALVPCCRQKIVATSGRQRESAATVTLVIGQQGSASCKEVALRLVAVTQGGGSARLETEFDQREVQLQIPNGGDAACCMLGQSKRMPRQTQSRMATQLEMRACIALSQIRLLGANLSGHFLGHVADNVSSDQHLAFSSLLQTIHSQQQALVLSVKVGDEPSPHLALLEAASPSSAHLSYLSLTLTLQVEKLMAVHGAGERSPCARVSLQDFKERVVRAVLTQRSTQGAQQRDQDGASEASRLWTGVLNPWHVAGGVSQLQSALDKLTNRMDQMTYLSDCEKSVLMEMKQAYRQENQTPLLLQPSLHSTPSSLPHPRTGSGDCGGSSRDGLDGEGRMVLRRESSLLARGRLMVSKAKSATNSNLLTDEVDGDCMPVVTADILPKLDFSHVDVKSVEALGEFAEEQYQRVLQTGLGMETTVQSLVTVTQHFMASQQHSLSPQKCAVDFLKEKILKSCKELKACYQNPAADEDVKTKIIEFKLQILLRLEMESVCSSVEPSEPEQSADQVVELLRSLLFVTNAGEVPDFLNTTILTNYLSTLPQLLVRVYDELMQPLPPALAAFGSPGTTPSVAPGPLSVSSQHSVGPGSAPPGSNQSNNSQRMRTRSSLRSHPSLSGLCNKRQIVVQAKAVKKTKGEVKVKARSESKSPAKHHRARAEVKKARRNLFNTHTGKKPSTSEGTDKQRATPRKKRRHASSRKREGSKTMVAETPRHRQHSRLAWQREQVAKQLSRSGPPDVQVIAESPVKQIADLKSSPGRYKPARRVLRQAFYPAGKEHQSRNLTKALQLADSGTGLHHRHQHLRASLGGRLSEALKAKDNGDEGEEGLLSPRRQAAAFLRAQLMKSPSPDLQSPSWRTRSRTPQRFPRQRLFDDGLSLPAWSSAMSLLDFTSPTKRSAASTFQVAETPPRASGQRGAPVENTPTKVEGRSSKVTPRKSRAGTSGQVTPQKSRPGTTGQVTPQKSRAATTGQVTPQKSRAGTTGQVTPQKTRSRTTGQVTPQKSRPGTMGQVTPQKSRAATMGQVTPQKSRAGTTGQVTPQKTRSRTTGQVTPQKSRSGTMGQVTPQKSGSGTTGQDTPQKTRAGTTGQVTPQKTRSRTMGQVTPQKSRPGTTGQVIPHKSRAATTGQVTPQKIRAGTTGQVTHQKTVEGSSGQVTPQKTRPGSSGQVTPSTADPNARKWGEGQFTAERGEAGRLSLRKSKPGPTTPKKGERGRGERRGGSRRLKGVSPAHSSSSSSSQQSSILDYVSPSRRPGTGLAENRSAGANPVSSPTLSSRRCWSADLTSARSGGGSITLGSSLAELGAANGSGSSSWGLLPDSSHTLTPTKTAQPFRSPTKTPTKPILKNSPSLKRSQSAHGAAVGTPQKSPRVTFDMDPRRRDARTPSPTGERVVKTPDSMDKWRRRKRRWASDGNKSPLSSSSAEGSDLFSQPVRGGTDVSDSAVCRNSRVSTLRLERDSNKAEFTGGAPGLSTGFPSVGSRKRSSVFSEIGDTSSPGKKRRANSCVAAGFSKPTAFSEDAMDSYGLNASDSYFTASNDDVFLGSFEEPVPFSSPGKKELEDGGRAAHRQGSPQFKGKSPSRAGLTRCKSSFAFEGSQGFEIATAQESRPPSSPTFSTSPAPKQRTRDEAQSGQCRMASRTSSQTNPSASKGKGKGRTSSKLKTLPKTEEPQDQAFTRKEAGAAGPSRATSEFLTPIRSALASSTECSSLTPLRVKGTPTDRKYSPTVSTTSLVQLMNSPILLQDPRLPKGRLSRDGLAAGHDCSPNERPRKKPKPMPPFLD